MPTVLRTYVLAISLLGLGCRASSPPVASPEPPAPEPPAVEPAPSEPEPTAPEALPTSWHAIAEPVTLAAERVSGNDTGARYALAPEGAGQPSFELELRVSEAQTELRLSEPSSGLALAHTWANGSCSDEFYDGDGAGAAITETARDDQGRRLLELWVNCGSGEDIRFIDSIMLLILADADGMSLLWSGETHEHSSFVCGNWTDLDVTVLDTDELLIDESEYWQIFDPDEVPYYDCDDARDDERQIAEHRVPLPGP